MSPWFKNYALEDLNRFIPKTILEHLDIRFTDFGENSISASMPVDHRTVQPFGILHGGASVVLAETLGSVAATLTVDPDKEYCVGLDINANHLKQVREGRVTGTTTPIHIGRRTQVWSIDIKNEADQSVCICRITMMVVSKK